jgi:hypothetical protein
MPEWCCLKYGKTKSNIIIEIMRIWILVLIPLQILQTSSSESYTDASLTLNYVSTSVFAKSFEQNALYAVNTYGPPYVLNRMNYTRHFYTVSYSY